jgi:catecholate siderophore receptor
VLTGAQRSSGIEFSLNGKILTGWHMSLGYANTKAEITQTTTAAPTGRRIAQVPRHQLSLWNRYDLNDQFGLGLGLYHQSSQFTTISNSVRLPGYTRVDAAAYYAMSDKIKMQVNIENLFDTDYFPVAHNDNNISPGAPINARLSVSVAF